MIDDKEKKQLLHPSADEMNRIERYRTGREYLACGAKTRSKEGFCKQPAGRQTPHKGHGRCYLHGGMTTGPKTAAGKAKASQNGRKHGFYSPGLTPRERVVYESQTDKVAVSLTDEIKMMRTKVLIYLEEWQAKFEQEGEASIRVPYRIVSETEDGERISEIAGYYRAATIEDRPLMRALNELGRMVERQARLNPDEGGDIISQINAELRAASRGQVTLSWANRQAQFREDVKE